MSDHAFQVGWSETKIDELRAALKMVELPPAPPGAGWSLGCDRDFLLKFRDYVVDEFDWTKAQANLNQYPQFQVEIKGIPIHYVHVKGEGSNCRPLLLTHGWPGSHYEFWDVIEPLSRPSLHQGGEAFDLIIPSLPGYGFSGKPDQPIGPYTTARLWNELMTVHLGYDHYLAQGGDWGAVVTSFLGLNHSEHVGAIHLNFLAFRSAQAPQTDEEAEWDTQLQHASSNLSGYSSVQIMKPQSLIWATAGNPLGQAAWILERFHDWSELDGRELDELFSMEHLATNILIYLMTDSFPSAIWFYHGFLKEIGNLPEAGRRCEVPTGYANFPHDKILPPPPRSKVEQSYNIQYWSDPALGGHFAAMEQPKLFIEDIQKWAAGLQSNSK